MPSGMEAQTAKVGSKARDKQFLGISRRRMILASLGGVAITIPGVSANCRRANTKEPIRIAFKGPFQRGSFQRGSCGESQVAIPGSVQASWFSIQGLLISFNLIEPFAQLKLLLHDTSDFPKESFRISGRIIGHSGKTLARASQTFDASRVPRKPHYIDLGMVKARVEPIIEHNIHFPSNVRVEDMSRMEWEIDPT